MTDDICVVHSDDRMCGRLLGGKSNQDQEREKTGVSTTYKYILVTATSSGILKAKQKLGRTFNSDKLGGIAFTKISKLTMCSA